MKVKDQSFMLEKVLLCSCMSVVRIKPAFAGDSQPCLSTDYKK